MRQQRLVWFLFLTPLFILVTLVISTSMVSAPNHSARTQPSLTYADYGNQAITDMLRGFFVNGNWKVCMSGCRAINTDWGADALTYTLFLRWEIASHDPKVLPNLQTLAGTAPTWQAPCQTMHNCNPPWSDQPLWDSVALGREYEATGMQQADILAKEEAAFNVVDGAGPSLYLFGACPRVRYQHPGGSTRLKTLESDSNYIKAALLLYRFTHDSSYLAKARAEYAAVRHSFLDAKRPLYTVYVFDNGGTCQQVAGRFFASVNGNMIDNGLELAQDTGDTTYRNEALATAHAVANDLSDANGVFADLQAENDTVEPLIEAMYRVATEQNQDFARTWILTAASASASALNSRGAYTRSFDGPPQVGTGSAWQTSGGYALAIAAAQIDPSGRPATTARWANAITFPISITTASLPQAITFTGTGIALIGTLGEQCCEPGHARVFIDGVETIDTTGIWQNKSSPGISIPDTVLFAWRWPSTGRHTIDIQPGVFNAKEGGPFIDIQAYLVTP